MKTKFAIRGRVSRRAIVRHLVVLYRHYTYPCGMVCMGVESVRAELRELRVRFGWPLVARIQLLRLHDAIEEFKRRREGEWIASCI